MMYFQRGSESTELSPSDIQQAISHALDQLGERQKVLAIPPDITRFHSGSGPITRYISDYYGSNLTDVLPALGTHTPMTDAEIERMYAGVPKELFRVHDWRNDVVTVGIIPGKQVFEMTDGLIDTEWTAQLNKLVYQEAMI